MYALEDSPIDAPLSTQGDDPDNAVTGTPTSTEDEVVKDLQVILPPSGTPISSIRFNTMSIAPSSLPPSSPPSVKTASKAAMFQQIVKLASRKALESEIEQQLISSLAPEVQAQVRASSNVYHTFVQAIKDGQVEQADRLSKEFNECYWDLKAEMAKNTELTTYTAEQADRMIELQADLKAMQEKMEQLHIQALGQLAVLQTRVQAVLTQTYELHEYPIPRLFVVLPQNPSRWDAANPFSNKFRLYFLCECGEHTKSIDSKDEIPHIHFAKHEGYEINRPSEFFRQWGPHILTILKMLKYGISVAGVAVPAISHLVRVDVIDEATDCLKQLKDNIEPGMDHVINWMDKLSVNEGEAVDQFANQMENKEALEGADLRKLDTFLKGKDGRKVMGNLYRTVTDEGHVKWVCIDHYSENYHKSTAKEFQRVLDSVGGSFDKSIGRVEVKIQSRVLAEQFSSVLGKARSVYELDIAFDWACTTNDLEVLEGALKTSTSISILRLDLRQFRTGLGTKLLSTSVQYGALFRFIKLPNLKIVHIILPKEFIRHLTFQPKTPSHLHKLSFEMAAGSIGGKELGILTETLKTNSILTTLDLQDNSIGEDGAKALAEALKTNKTLSTLDLWHNSIGDDGAKALAEALKTNSTLSTLGLWYNSVGDDGAKALAEALKNNSTLSTLGLWYNSIGDGGAKALAEALNANSTLTTLGLWYNPIGDDGVKALTEAQKTNSTLNTMYLLAEALTTTNSKVIFMPTFASQEKLWGSSVPASVVESVSKKERNKQEVIFEVIQTEYYYVHDLVLLEEIFIMPLRASNIVHPERLEEFIEGVFMNYKELLALNKQLLADLRVRQEEQPLVESIGDILLAHIARFEQAYTSYISRLTISQFMCKREEARNPKLARFLADCAKHPEARRLSLHHFITLPHNRISRYPLLLNAIIRYTDEGVPDRETVKQVVQLLVEQTKRVDALYHQSNMLNTIHSS
ncbi:RHO1 GDP-GTP exchange protein 2 [Dissophora globulifera]|nr:RHO1 GDP-GTP exchange protein 2 [Dissophora globulifera]